jgi:hypothetical protein
VERAASAWGTAALIVVIALLARRNARKKVSRLYQQALEQQVAGLVQRAERGALEALPPTKAMREIEQRIFEAVQLGQVLERALAVGEVSPDQAAELRGQLASQMTTLRAQHLALDVERRVDVKLDPNLAAEPEPATWRERLRVLLVSRGVVSSLGGAGRALYYAALLLLVPSLVGFTSGPAGATLTARVVSLDQLRVARSAEQAEREYAEALTSLPPAPAAEAVDSAVLDRVARAFEDAAFSMSGRAIGASVNSAMARNRILGVAVADDPARPLARATTLAEAPIAGGPVARVLRDYERTQGTAGPRTGIGRRFRAELAAQARAHPPLAARLREIPASFPRPANTDDVGRVLLRYAFGDVLEGVGAAEHELGPFVEALTRGVETDLRRAYDVQSRLFLTELARGQGIERAQAAVIVADARHPRWTAAAVSRIEGIMKEHMPAGADLLEHY